MGTALFTGVTALLANQRRLDVIASNIANVNTTGYRSARVLFQDLFSQTLQGARAPDANSGGSNPIQVGLGIRIASIDLNFTQGSLFTTGLASDLAIQGSGFFALRGGSGTVFTRDGSFALNANGALIDPASGFIVQGFLADQTGTIVAAVPEDIVVPVGATSIVRATENVTLIGNLDAATAVGDTVERTVRVFDSLGTARDVSLTFTKDLASNEWTWDATYTDPSVVAPAVGTGTLVFDNDGNFVSATSTTVSLDFVAGLPALPIDPFVFDLGFTAITQLTSTSDVAVQNQDGFPRGTLETFNIGAGGVINGVFTNGLTRVIGQVALATFSNTGGLERIGDNMFRDTPGSGTAQIGMPGTGGRGAVSGGVLEGSNVDLGTEFSNLIVTQRSFQANARTITTADTLLQETVNLIR